MTTTTAPPPPAAPAPEPPGPPPGSHAPRTGGAGRPDHAQHAVRGLPRGARAVVDVLVLAAAVLAALTPLLPVYGSGVAGGGSVLLRPVAGGVVLGVAIGVLTARARWSALATTATLLAAVLLAGGPLAAPDSTLAGVVPTPASVVVVVRGAVLGWKDVLTLQPPLGGSGWLLVPPYLLAAVGAAVAVRVALGGRAASAAAVVPVGCLAVAVLLGSRTTVLPAVVGTALAVVLVTWASWRSGRLRARRLLAVLVLLALAAGAGLGAGAVVGAQRDRFVLRDALVPPFDPRDYASPLSAFRAFVKDDDTVDLFTVTGLPDGARIRLATFDRFDGVVWNVAGDGSSRASGEFRRVGDTISDEAAEQAATAAEDGGTRVEVQVRVDELDGVWLPTVGDTTSVRFADADDRTRLRFNDATGAAVLTGGLGSGLTYTLDAVLPAEPDDDAIGGAAAQDLDLPEPVSVPDAVSVAAGDAAREATTPVQVARALEQALAENGFFSHGRTDQGDYPSLSGHGADRVASLLGGDLMVGDDEQYASAMALMAREMGLPARVVLGFVPGGEDAAGTGDAAGSGGDAAAADGSVVVTGADVHAWVEIAFDGAGWVTFDPTPPESQTPQDEDETSRSDPDPQVVQPPPPAAEPVDPPEDDTEQPETQDSPQEAARPLWQWVALGAAGASGLVLLLLAPFLVIAGIKASRRRRRRRDPEPLRRVVGGWQEVLDLATDLRHDVDPLATRRESARALDAAFAGAGAGVGQAPRPHGRTEGGPEAAALAAHADAAVFGPADPTGDDARAYWSQVDRALARMQAAVPRGRRWRARVTTRSLRRARAARGGPGDAERRAGSARDARPAADARPAGDAGPARDARPARDAGAQR